MNNYYYCSECDNTVAFGHDCPAFITPSNITRHGTVGASMMNNYEYTRITLTASSYNTKVSVQLPMDSDANEVFAAFKTLMVGLTFSPQAFDDAVLRYVDEYGLNTEEM